MHKGRPFFDLLDGNGFSPAVSCRSLQTDHARLRSDGFFQSIEIDLSIRCQFHLVVGDSEVHQGAFAAAADSDRFLQRIIRCSGTVDQLISRSQNACQGQAQRMCAIDDDRPDQRCLGMEDIRVNALRCFTASVIISVACIPGEMSVADAVFLKRVQHLVLVICHNIVQFIKERTDFLFTGVYKLQNRIGNAEFLMQ